VDSFGRRKSIYGVPPRATLIPMFAQFVERGLALRASDFFKGMLR
jgi:hypothetical protein